jgi:uncharacterized membrane protein YesL
MPEFNYDNFVIRALNKMTDLLVLNIMFIVFSLPVVTIGAALTAMYAVSLKSVRYGDGYVAKRFLVAFKDNFKQATLAWLIILTAGVLLFLDIRFWQQVDFGVYGKVMLAVSYAIAGVLIVWATWVFPVISKMRDKLSAQLKNAAKMAVGYFIPYTLVLVLIEVAAVYCAIVNVGMMMIMLVIGFAGVSYICSFFIYSVFAKIITEDSLGDDDLLYGPK